MNGDCPVGAANKRDIANLARTCDDLRTTVEARRKAVQAAAIEDAVTGTTTKLLLIALPGVGSIIGGIVTALVMRALGA